MTSPIFANLDGLVRLARERGVDVNPTLLRVLTDLYVQRAAPSSDEQRQFTEIALRLIDSVDEDTLAIVARKLVACPQTPAAVLARLAGGATHRRTPVAAEPQPIPRIDTGAVDLSFEAFLSADANERRLILSSAGATPVPSPLRVDPAATVRELETCALSNKPGEFTRMLVRALAISQTLAQQIVNDRSGEPLLVALKALAMPREVFQRILLFVNPAVGHSVRRVYDLSDLYSEVTTPQALHLVASWRADTGQARAAEHQPYSWDDDRRRARDVATPSRSTTRADGTANSHERRVANSE